MILPEAQQYLLKNLLTLYDEREAATVTDWIMEKITGLKKIDRILLRDRPLSANDQGLLKKYTEELLTHRPIQYVLGESWFYGLRFRVDERVLIPRPETEELVEWILGETDRDTTIRILDIGTGSGCIPILLKKHLPSASVFACDISRDALDLARENAADNEVAVGFFHLDILRSLPAPAIPGIPIPPATEALPTLPVFDLIVSNPPYIPLKDSETMSPNVFLFEPSMALFVNDDDPLLFYRAIAGFAGRQLAPGGTIFFELHEDLGEETGRALRQYGFGPITFKKDMQGKDRMLKASVTKK